MNFKKIFDFRFLVILLLILMAVFAVLLVLEMHEEGKQKAVLDEEGSSNLEKKNE